MRILLVNDDGYGALGLTTLAAALQQENHDVFVTAPAMCVSGMGHAMTFKKPVQVQRVFSFGWTTYAVHGTPADCILIGLHLMGENPPELIISGVNHGTNLGTELQYSGTVGAAAEGAVRGIPSIAVSASAKTEEEFLHVSRFFMKNLTYYLSLTAKDVAIHVCLHRNQDESLPHKFVHMGERLYDEAYTVTQTESGHIYVLDGAPLPGKNGAESDVRMFEAGYPVIIPVTNDFTHYARLAEWKKRFPEGAQ